MQSNLMHALLVINSTTFYMTQSMLLTTVTCHSINLVKLQEL